MTDLRGPYPQVHGPTRQAVAVAWEEYVIALTALEEAIYEAHKAGNSLRVISEMTGWSHQKINELVQKYDE